MQIFDENENELTEEDIDDKKNIICILEVLGIKFTTTSIRIELCLRQIMVLNSKPIFTRCLINRKKNPQVDNILISKTVLKTKEAVLNTGDNESELDKKAKGLVKDDIKPLNSLILNDLDEVERNKIKKDVSDDLTNRINEQIQK